MNGEKTPKENNGTAEAWQNMASKVSEMTKNMNKTELGKRALRVAIIGLTTAAIASFAISKGEKDSVNWAENPTATEFDAGTGGTVDNSVGLTDEEAARIFKEKGGSTNSEKSDENFQGNEANPNAGLTPELDKTDNETIQAGDETPPVENTEGMNNNPEDQQDWAEQPTQSGTEMKYKTSDPVAENPPHIPDKMPTPEEFPEPPAFPDFPEEH